jgi:hypothetical protein
MGSAVDPVEFLDEYRHLREEYKYAMRKAGIQTVWRRVLGLLTTGVNLVSSKNAGVSDMLRFWWAAWVLESRKTSEGRVSAHYATATNGESGSISVQLAGSRRNRSLSS